MEDTRTPASVPEQQTAATRPRIPSYEELYGDAFRQAMTETAPPCSECGGKLVAEAMPEVNKIGQVEPNGDRVIRCLEVYRCQLCSRQIVRNIELDRETADERDREIERSISRAEMRRQRPFLMPMKAWEREVLDRFPRREEPDLLERWKESHAAR